MKDLSFFYLKNSLAAKMKKGLKSFCNGAGSTSTLNQRTKIDVDASFMMTPSLISTEYSGLGTSPRTLEEMMAQLDLEEEVARRERLDHYGELHRRMSCVNNSDILRSARNALNQYPRFSLDGRDAMFRNFTPKLGDEVGRSLCCPVGLRGRFDRDGYGLDLEKNRRLPPTLAGESVAWCKPGVVARLMGLEAMPVPLGRRNSKRKLKGNLRKIDRQEFDRRRVIVGPRSTTGYCVFKPIAVEAANCSRGWQGRPR